MARNPRRAKGLANITAMTSDSDAPSLSQAEHEALAAGGGRVILYHLSGPFSFGAAKGMARRLTSGDHYDALVLDLVEVTFIDSSAALGLGDAITIAQAGGKRVFLVGARAEVAEILAPLGVLDLLPEQHRGLSRLEALKRAAAETR